MHEVDIEGDDNVYMLLFVYTNSICMLNIYMHLFIHKPKLKPINTYFCKLMPLYKFVYIHSHTLYNTHISIYSYRIYLKHMYIK